MVESLCSLSLPPKGPARKARPYEAGSPTAAMANYFDDMFTDLMIVASYENSVWL